MSRTLPSHSQQPAWRMLPDSPPSWSSWCRGRYSLSFPQSHNLHITWRKTTTVWWANVDQIQQTKWLRQLHTLFVFHCILIATLLPFFSVTYGAGRTGGPELQKRADQSVLILPSWCWFLGKACKQLCHYVQCSMSIAHITYTIAPWANSTVNCYMVSQASVAPVLQWFEK